jgi:putative MATE family efflux protein
MWSAERLRRLLFVFPDALARLGLVDRAGGRRAFDLALPVMVTGGLRTLQRVVDFLMIGRATGAAGVAALELGFQYFFVPFGLSLALTSGTISVVSRAIGAEDTATADLAVTVSLWIALALSIPITVGTWVGADRLLGLLTDDPQVVRLGADYLRVVMLSVGFRFWSMIAARALAGAGDTRTPMYVRLVTLPTNLGLNALLIYGRYGVPRLGVTGAALGTAAANALAGVIFLAIMLSGRWSVALRLRGRLWDGEVARELVRVGLPLAGTRLSRTFARFPFLFVLGVLGTDVVAAYAVGRRVMLLALMPAWGYATASSTLVGQHVGRGEPDRADELGWQTLRVALVTQLLIGGALALAARPVAAAFGAEAAGLTATFVRVFGVGVAAFSVARTLRGGLRGAGDTRWPLYGSLLGSYAVRLPIVALALPVGFGVSLLGVTVAPGLGWGVPAAFAAILADMYTRAAVNLWRYHSDAWRELATVPAGAD